MVMAPIDLRGREFRKAFRGYAEEEVDAFMELVVNDYETLYRELLALKDKLAHQEDNMGHYRGLEDTLKSTLIVAQKTAEDMRASVEQEVKALQDSSRREAEIILREAENKALDIIRTAQERGQTIVREYGEIQKQAQVFKFNMRSLLQSQLELLNHNSAASEAIYEQGMALEQWVAKEQSASTKEASRAFAKEVQKEAPKEALKAVPKELSGEAVKKDLLKEPRYNPEQQED